MALPCLTFVPVEYCCAVIPSFQCCLFHVPLLVHTFVTLQVFPHRFEFSCFQSYYHAGIPFALTDICERNNCSEEVGEFECVTVIGCNCCNNFSLWNYWQKEAFRNHRNSATKKICRDRWALRHMLTKEPQTSSGINISTKTVLGASFHGFHCQGVTCRWASTFAHIAYTVIWELSRFKAAMVP